VPRLIGNTGEFPYFVLPALQPNEDGNIEASDDLAYATTWTLTAHEARPGHEMQFSSMIEGGVSITRVVFAFNSANVEGWALYAEAITKLRWVMVSTSRPSTTSSWLRACCRRMCWKTR
jgi:hypothetical protein